ncbi:MAG: ABC transporter ATP-binding protein [Armatimonadetes bacterium]|nr:ABC transporter ATP-binding protein [Armatimonadota bacterium]
MGEDQTGAAPQQPNDEREIQARLLAYLQPHRRVLLIGLVCAAFVAGLTALIAAAAKPTINAMAGDNVGRLNFICIIVVGVFVLKGIFSYGQTYYLSMVAQRVTTQLRDDIFGHLHSLSLSFFNQRRTGAIMSALTNDIPVIQNATMSIRDIVSAPLSVVFALGLLFYQSWRLTLAALIVVPVMGFVISRIGKKIRRISDVVQLRLADVSTIAEETIAGIRIIKSFATESHEITRFAEENARTYEAVLRGVRQSARLRPIIEFLGAFGIALVLFLGGNEVVQNARAVSLHKTPLTRLDLGGLTLFVLALQQLARAVSDIGSINTTRQQAFAAAGRIFREILDQETEVKEVPDAPLMPRIVGAIEFSNVGFAYNDDAAVLADISLRVNPGEVVALVGHSGAGKSTLVDLIPRFYDVTQGSISVDGRDIRSVQLESLRKQIGIVPQETWLFAGTLRDNIAYGRRDATDADVRAAAKAANANFIDNMPDGFETVVGERGVRLSGGERQRIAIARAILMDPRILILDEATSSLDASSESLVQAALEDLMKNRTTLVIAHRLSTILGADRIVVLDRGRIVETGTHAELLARGGIYSQLYEKQFRAETA